MSKAEKLIEEAKTNWKICNERETIIEEELKEDLTKENLQIEICADISISIDKERFDEVMEFKLANKYGEANEEESLVKLRVLWAAFLGVI